MRIIIKPMGLIVLGIAAVAGIAIPQLKGRLGSTGYTGTGASQKNLAPPAGWQAYNADGGFQVSRPLTTLPPGATTGVHIEAQKLGKDPWCVGYTQALTAAFSDKEPVTLTFWARAKSPQSVRIAMQFPTHSYHECWFREVPLSTAWKQYTFHFTTERFKSGEGNLAFQTGYQLGWVELAGIQLTRGN